MPALARVAVTVDPLALLEFWDAPRHLMHGRNKFDTTVVGPYWDYSLFMSLFLERRWGSWYLQMSPFLAVGRSGGEAARP